MRSYLPGTEGAQAETQRRSVYQEVCGYVRNLLRVEEEEEKKKIRLPLASPEFPRLSLEVAA